jgi:RecB family exonuclease
MGLKLFALFNKTWNNLSKGYIEKTSISEEEFSKARKDSYNMLKEYYLGFLNKIRLLVESEKAENEQHAFYLLKPKFRELKVESEQLKCKGYIDRIQEDNDKIVTIGDYKTSVKYGIGLNEEYRRQLAIYSLLYFEQEKEMPHFAAVIFLRYGEEYLLEVTPSFLRYAEDTIREVYIKTRSTNINDYPIKGGDSCRWCDHHKIDEEDRKRILEILRDKNDKTI